MKKTLAVAFFFGFICTTILAQLPGLDMLEVGDIQRITLGDTGSSVVARVTLTFKNKTESDLKLSSGDFKITAVRKDGDKILIGTSHIVDLLLPGKTAEQLPTEAELTLVLGSERKDIVQKLSALMLAVVDEKDQLQTILECSCDIGIKKGNAWQYVKGISFEFELDPNVNWDVIWDKTTKGGITISFGKDKP